jgi:hypothetical protein
MHSNLLLRRFIHRVSFTLSESRSTISSLFASNSCTSYLALSSLPHSHALSCPGFESHVQNPPQSSGESVRYDLKTSGVGSAAISLFTAPGWTDQLSRPSSRYCSWMCSINLSCASFETQYCALAIGPRTMRAAKLETVMKFFAPSSVPSRMGIRNLAH